MSVHKGFTLIELVVTIVILATLAVIAAPRFLNFQSDARIEVMTTVGSSMTSALSLIYSQAVIDGQDSGDGEITIGGVAVPLYNGYPAVDGSDSFDDLNEQVQAWLNIDTVSKTEIVANPDAAPFFIDKSTTLNQIYIFYSSAPTTGDRTEYGCQVRYQNPVDGDHSVRVLTSIC
ncbi:type II secretion system GspH family protein [Vibrio lamellibrachiae]|uniref:pilus assembly FimT family protein n=1 Tax=Vibrio lamellibrachiae TaxID=2910253 RepID=UPI003D0DC237